MRYTRLRRQIESGTLIGTHGTPFAATSVSEKKRKRSLTHAKKAASEDKTETNSSVGAGEEVDRGKRLESEKETEKKVKKELDSDGYGGDGDTTEGESDETDEWSSEDEIPLAKLRKARSKTTPCPQMPPAPSITDVAEREGAPVRDFPPAAQVDGADRRGEETRGTEQEFAYIHTTSLNATPQMYAPGLPMHLYAPVPLPHQVSMHTPLPPLGEAFGMGFMNQWNGTGDMRRLGRVRSDERRLESGCGCGACRFFWKWEWDWLEA
jgi:hypothetical protein